MAGCGAADDVQLHAQGVVVLLEGAADAKADLAGDEAAEQ